MLAKTLLLASLGLTSLPAAAQGAAMTDDARKTASALLNKLAGTLQEEMKKGGPEAAIGVCKDVAPQLTGDASRKTGSRVTRVSLKVRNPLLGMPDAWETAALDDFEKRLAAGEPAAKLEKSEAVSEAGRQYFRYIKAIPTQPICLYCHGPAGTITEPVKSKLSAEYPHDKAIGYGDGQIRGGVSIKRPM